MISYTKAVSTKVSAWIVAALLTGLSAALVAPNLQQKDEEAQAKEVPAKSNLELSGEQAQLLASVFELAFQPDSKRKYRLIHRKLMNQFVPLIWGGLAMSGSIPNPTPEQAAKVRQQHDFFLKEIEAVHKDDDPSIAYNVQAWNDIPREEIVDLIFRLQEGLDEPGRQGFLDQLVDEEIDEIQSVDIAIEGAAATVALRFERVTVTFAMEKPDALWQLVEPDYEYKN